MPMTSKAESNGSPDATAAQGVPDPDDQRQDPLGGNPGAGAGDEPIEIPLELPVLPLQDAVVFPDLSMPVLAARPYSLRLLKAVMADGDPEPLLAVVALKHRREVDDAEPRPEDLHEVGSVSRITQMVPLPNGPVQLVLQGVERIRLEGITASEPFLTAKVTVLRDELVQSDHVEALVRTVRQAFAELAELSPAIQAPIVLAAMAIDDPGDIADLIAVN